MAQLQIEADAFQPGRWALRSSNPAVLAAIPDALVQVLRLEHEALTVWALHPDEQAGVRSAAYRDEIREIGHGPHIEVVELARPWQHNVVWVDRFHLLVKGAPTTLGSRLLGLYVGSKGRIVLSVHHPSVSAIVQREFAAMPPDNGRDWDRMDHVANARFVLRHEPGHGAVQLRAPQSMAHSVQEGLQRLTQMVAGW